MRNEIRSVNLDTSPTLYETRHFGEEREPIIVIDNFCGHLAALVSAGRSKRYAPAQGYPGIRAPIDPRSFVENMARSSLLASAIRREFGATQIQFESCSFSIVTLQPEELSPGQRIPHFDEAGAHVVAFVHYLDTPSDSGTAFYRHRRTGFETITPERLDIYNDSKLADDEEYGPPPMAYQTGDTPSYERIGSVEAAPDRLIAYRGRQLHSGDIIVAPPKTNVQAEGRLTITGFLLLK